MGPWSTIYAAIKDQGKSEIGNWLCGCGIRKLWSLARLTYARMEPQRCPKAQMFAVNAVWKRHRNVFFQLNVSPYRYCSVRWLHRGSLETFLFFFVRSIWQGCKFNRGVFRRTDVVDVSVTKPTLPAARYPCTSIWILSNSTLKQSRVLNVLMRSISELYSVQCSVFTRRSDKIKYIKMSEHFL